MVSVCSMSGHDLDRGEAGLAAALVVERADPHQAVGAALDAEVAVGVGDVDLEGGALQAGLLGVAGVEHLDRVVVALGPAQVHAHEHLGEVGGVDATCAGADRDDGRALVVLAGEEGAHLELAHRLAHADELVLGLGEGLGVVLLLAHLDEGLEVVDPGVHAGDPVVLGLGAGEPGGDDLGLLLVVPEVRVGRLPLEVGDGRLELGQVGHLTHGRHGRAKVLDLRGEVDSHEGQAYASPGCRRPGRRGAAGCATLAGARRAGGRAVGTPSVPSHAGSARPGCQARGWPRGRYPGVRAVPSEARTPWRRADDGRYAGCSVNATVPPRACLAWTAVRSVSSEARRSMSC